MTAKFSMRTTLLCAAGAIALMTAIPVAHPASAQGLNDIVRNLNNTMNPSDAQRREDQARREDQLRREDRAHRREGWSEQEQYGRGHRLDIRIPRCTGLPAGGSRIRTLGPPAHGELYAKPPAMRSLDRRAALADWRSLACRWRSGRSVQASFLIETQEADRSARAARRRPTPTKSRSRPLNPCRAEAATRFQ
jgi:Ni/Co efflux regulator RcnB